MSHLCPFGGSKDSILQRSQGGRKPSLVFSKEGIRMSKLSVEQVPGDILLPTDDPPDGTHHDLPVGVPQERVDPHTLEVIQLLWKSKGLQFLAAFLCLASAKQCSLPGLGTLGTFDCAVITARSIRQLASRIGWGYDTTEKYLVVLVALGFLHKKKSSDGIEYYFPLHRYAAPINLDELETIIEKYRPKVQSFARKTKRRFLAYREQQKSTFLPLRSSASLPPPFDLSAAEADIEQIMQEELGNGALPQRLLLKLKGVLHYRCRSPFEQIPSQKGDSGDVSPTQESTNQIQKGDFPSLQKSTIAKNGNSFVAVATRKGRLPEQKGDFPSRDPEASLSQKSPISEQKGDSQTPTSLLNGRLPTQNGDLLSKKGDSKTDGPPNVNVILRNIIDSLNVNVGSVIEYLRTAFGEEPKKRGYYYNLYKQYQQSDAWLAATIETLLAYQKQTTKQPGKYFYDLCVTFHKNGIPQEVAERVRQYGQLTHEQLMVLLDHPPIQNQSSPTQATRPQSRRTPIVLHIPREKNHPGLTEQEARRVIELIRSDERTCTVSVVSYQQSDGSFALLIDNGGVPHPRQVWIYTIQECHARLIRMKLQKDFFQEKGNI